MRFRCRVASPLAATNPAGEAPYPAEIGGRSGRGEFPVSLLPAKSLFEAGGKTAGFRNSAFIVFVKKYANIP